MKGGTFQKRGKALLLKASHASDTGFGSLCLDLNGKPPR